jgi:hypothetical protein
MSPGELRLRIDNRPTGLVVRPDDRYPSMWRHPLYQGRASDTVNLSRAKDAALSWLRISGRMR